MVEIPHRLVVKAGPNPGSAFDLSKEVTLIGRDVTNDISLGDAEVSRQHARLTRTPGGYVLEDLGSTNGSFVNGERLVAPRVLATGDLLGMGENVTLSFEGTSPETAETVMGEAVQHGAAPTPEAMQEAISQPDAGPRGRSRTQRRAEYDSLVTGRSRLPGIAGLLRRHPLSHGRLCAGHSVRSAARARHRSLAQNRPNPNPGRRRLPKFPRFHEPLDASWR